MAVQHLQSHLKSKLKLKNENLLDINSLPALTITCDILHGIGVIMSPVCEALDDVSRNPGISNSSANLFP